MSWLSYLAGILTLPTVAFVDGSLLWALNKNYGLECDNCGKVIGRLGVDPRLGTEVRWRVHYLRYWYRTRPRWTCDPRG